jgi:hypothetical protein
LHIASRTNEAHKDAPQNSCCILHVYTYLKVGYEPTLKGPDLVKGMGIPFDFFIKTLNKCTVSHPLSSDITFIQEKIISQKVKNIILC